MKKIIFASILIIFISCNGYEPEKPIDPKQAILGKWERIATGNWPDMHPDQPSYYIEFLQDSLVGWYDYETKEYNIKNYKYWIDSLFHIKYEINGQDDYILNYSYEFYEDKLRTNVLDVLPIYETIIYQRKK